MAKIGERILDKAFEILDANPDGVRYSDLIRLIAASDPSFNTNHISGKVWDLHEQYPNRVYKPVRGLFRLTKFREPGTDQLKEELLPKQPKRTKRRSFTSRSPIGS